MTSAVTVAAASPRFVKPVVGGVTSPFGMRGGKLHAGTDYGAPLGALIVASAAGKVVRASWFDGYGLCVDLDHGGGYLTRYAHQSKILVKRGESVEQGQRIGMVGSTGDSTGPHLHFEIRVNGRAVNPETFLKGEAKIPGEDTGGLVDSYLSRYIPPNLQKFLGDVNDPKFWLRAAMLLLGLGLIFSALVFVMRAPVMKALDVGKKAVAVGKKVGGTSA